MFFTIESYLKSLGIKVELKNIPDEWGYVKGNTITIHSGLDDEAKRYMTLHEFAHWKRDKKNSFDESDPVAVFEEEVLCWADAIETARTMNMPIDKTRWQEIKMECLRTFYS